MKTAVFVQHDGLDVQGIIIVDTVHILEPVIHNITTISTHLFKGHMVEGVFMIDSFTKSYL